VQFKYSSTEFKSGTGEESADSCGFYFDKHGLVLPYPAFINLMTNSKFHLYVKRCAEFKEKDEKALCDRRRNAVLEIEPRDETFANQEERGEEEEEEEEEEEDQEKQTGSKSSKRKKPSEPVVEGAVKKHRFLPPPPPPPTSPTLTKPINSQIAARLTEAVRNIKQKL
jgi:hypothetical protein